MRSLRFFLPLLIACLGRLEAGTIVQLDTPVGSMKFELYDTAKPITVANFLSYIMSGRYENTFAHRLPQGFVLQGGGFGVGESGFFAVETYEPIVNEAGPFPEYSNIFGTISMAKLGEDQPGGGPNSATSSWFINLGDNSENLDNQNGGFTVFGHIIDGEEVLQTFADFVKLQQGQTNGNEVIVSINLNVRYPDGFIYQVPFSDLPVAKVTNSTINLNDFIFTDWSIVPETGVLNLIVIGLGILWIRHRKSAAMFHR